MPYKVPPNNALYLDETSRKAMISAIHRSSNYLAVDESEKQDIWDKLFEARDAILEGIGYNYLPDDTKDALKELDDIERKQKR